MQMYLVETERPEPVPIEDLSIVVRMGVPKWITKAQKQASLCLRRLVNLGHVTVSPGERSREEKMPPKRPTVQSVRLSRPQRQARVPQEPQPLVGQAPNRAPTPRTEPALTHADVQEMVTHAAQLAANQAANQVASQVLAALPAPAATTPGLTPEEIAAQVQVALKDALKGYVGAPAGHPSGSGPDEPLFIPEGIVSAGDKTELAVTSESTEDGGLGDAADALKKLRKTKPGRKTKKTKEK